MAEPTIAHWRKYGMYEGLKFWTHPPVKPQCIVMKCLSNGIMSEVKKQSKVKSWTGMLKILLEWRNVVLELNEID